MKYSTELHSSLVSSGMVLFEKSISKLQACACKITTRQVLSDTDLFLLFKNLLFFGGKGGRA